MTPIIMILIIVVIYIVSVLLWLFTTYILDRKSNNTVGALIDNTKESVAFIPILNTLFYPIALLILILSIIGDLISSSKFWNKIRNIKI